MGLHEVKREVHMASILGPTHIFTHTNTQARICTFLHSTKHVPRPSTHLLLAVRVARTASQSLPWQEPLRPPLLLLLLVVLALVLVLPQLMVLMVLMLLLMLVLRAALRGSQGYLPLVRQVVVVGVQLLLRQLAEKVPVCGVLMEWQESQMM